MVNGVIVVGRVNKTTRDEAQALHAQLESLEAPVLGVVANRTSRRGYYGYYGQGGGGRGPRIQTATTESETETFHAARAPLHNRTSLTRKVELVADR